MATKKKKEKRPAVTLMLLKLASYSDGKGQYRKGKRYSVEADEADVLMRSGHFRKIEGKKKEKLDDE